MAAFAGVRGTGDWGTQEYPGSYRESILWMNPEGDTPIFGLMNKMRNMRKDAPDFSWWNEPNGMVILQTNAAFNSAATSLTVDSGDPTASDPNKPWGSALNLVPGDVLMVVPADDTTLWDPEHLLVTAVTSATAFTVQRGFGGSLAAAIGDNQKLMHIGTAFPEGAQAPKVASRNPLLSQNRMQIFRTTAGVTGTADKTAARTGPAYKNDKRRKLFDHSRSIEMAILYGKKSLTTDAASGQHLRTTDGLRRLIPNKVLNAGWDVDNLLDTISPVFDWNTEAGKSRMAFCGYGALNAWTKKLRSTSGIEQVNYPNSASMYGIKFTQYRIPAGSIYMSAHPLMTRDPLMNNAMLILDGASVGWCHLQGRDTKFVDNIELPGEDAVKGQWLTEGGVFVDRLGLTCMYVGGFGN